MTGKMKMKQLLGSHLSIAGGVSKAAGIAEKLSMNTMQIFTKNNNRWESKPLEKSEIERFRSRVKELKLNPVISHDSYLVNLCASDPAILQKSRESFLDEAFRCEQLGIQYLNFHPGGHKGMGEKDGIKLIAESLNLIHYVTKNYKVKSMLEVTAGQGSAIGYRFEQIREIIDLIEDKKRMCVCIDTAHIFAAGYDIRTPEKYEAVMNEFDDIIGLQLLKCFHVNDSKKPLGSRVDRHDHIGDGQIGLQGFWNIMNDKRFVQIPKILETPKDKDYSQDIMNINRLLSLVT